MEKDWEARFADKATGLARISQLVRSGPMMIAGAYWIAVLMAFFRMQHAGYDMIGTGALLIAYLTAPCSLLSFAIANSISLGPGEAQFRQFLTSDSATFVIFPVFGGGLNAALIFALASAIQRYHRRSR